MSAKFEVVSRFANANLPLPSRKTAFSAGYDLAVAEDIIIPSYMTMMTLLSEKTSTNILTLTDMSALTKKTGIKPSLVSTGVKCKLDKGTYLELSVRSSTPLKYWLVLANSVGIIDADYYNNPDNEGEIFLQVINLSPFSIQLHKGDTIGQAIIKPYLEIAEDDASGERLGGFGSTGT